jgi:predicted DsbA family dithiol-disulfide isomerase
MSLAVDGISDMMCSRCYIGKRGWKAVAALDGPVKARWLPFQRNPTIREYRGEKFGSMVARLLRRVPDG